MTSAELSPIFDLLSGVLSAASDLFGALTFFTSLS